MGEIPLLSIREKFRWNLTILRIASYGYRDPSPFADRSTCPSCCSVSVLGPFNRDLENGHRVLQRGVAIFCSAGGGGCFVCSVCGGCFGGRNLRWVTAVCHSLSDFSLL
jgi:hypothetical protein